MKIQCSIKCRFGVCMINGDMICSDSIKGEDLIHLDLVVDPEGRMGGHRGGGGMYYSLVARRRI